MSMEARSHTTEGLKRNVGRLSTVIVAVLIGIPAGHAAGYPEKPVRWVIPSTPAGATDKVTRMVQPRLAEYLGQPVVTDNRPGATGNIGAEHVARSAPDGYTVLTVIGSHASNAALGQKIPFDLMRDFTPVSLIAIAPSVLIGHPALPASGVKQLVALIKAHPKRFEYASGGIGSIQHMSMELLLTMTGQKMLHIPYKATHPALMDVIAGHVPLMVIATASALPQARAGRVRAYGVTSAKRMTAAPDIATIAEQGLPGYEAVQWFGMLLPAGTPKEVTAKLHAGLTVVLKEPQLQKLFVADGVEPAPSATPEEFGVFIRAELLKWAKVVKTAGITAQ